MTNRCIEVAPGVELSVKDVGRGEALVIIPGRIFGADVFDQRSERILHTFFNL